MVSVLWRPMPTEEKRKRIVIFSLKNVNAKILVRINKLKQKVLCYLDAIPMVLL